MRALFPLHLAATLFMTGLIWFVQAVHYPLFARVGAEGFREYATIHSQRTAWVVLPVMTIELVTAVLLLARRPAWFSAGTAWTGLALLAAIWLSTALLQVPQHATLAGGFDAGAYRWLVQSNWLRTVGWSARSALLLACWVRGS